MTSLRLDAAVADACNRAILLSGPARSGTTILGKILHSLEPVEYSYEPPMMFSLVPLVDVLDDKIWKLLFGTYLYEEFLVNAVAGRALNCNRADDSSIFRVKSEEEIARRLERSIGKAESAELASTRIPVVKVPSIVPFLPSIQAKFPGMRFVLTVRRPDGVIGSLMRKNWFGQDALVAENRMWPLRESGEGRVPFWVPVGDEGRWLRMGHVDRCGYYYLVMAKATLELEDPILIGYSELLGDPTGTCGRIQEQLGLHPGLMTDTLIADVRPQGNTAFPLDGLSQDLRRDVEEVSRRLPRG